MCAILDKMVRQPHPILPKRLENILVKVVGMKKESLCDNAVSGTCIGFLLVGW